MNSLISLLNGTCDDFIFQLLWFGALFWNLFKLSVFIDVDLNFFNERLLIWNYFCFELLQYWKFDIAPCKRG